MVANLHPEIKERSEYEKCIFCWEMKIKLQIIYTHTHTYTYVHITIKLFLTSPLLDIENILLQPLLQLLLLPPTITTTNTT